MMVANRTFPSSCARALACTRRNTRLRLRHAAGLGITERSAHAIVTDLTTAGYVVKHKDGRRNRYQIQEHLPLHEPTSQGPAIGDLLAVLVGKHDAQGTAHRR
jgi:hypothetical protein